MYLPNDPFQCHPYFIENGENSVLVDPGSMLEFDAVVRKIDSISSMKHIKYIILHHQDPDLAASVPAMEKLIDREDLQVITHSRMVPLVKHYLITSDYYEIDKHAHQLECGNLKLKFITTPYCHSPGAFVTYEPRTKTLFPEISSEASKSHGSSMPKRITSKRPNNFMRSICPAVTFSTMLYVK
jgi:flavorubredoxin